MTSEQTLLILSIIVFIMTMLHNFTKSEYIITLLDLVLKLWLLSYLVYKILNSLLGVS